MRRWKRPSRLPSSDCDELARSDFSAIDRQAPMAAVEVSFTPLASHVRTARLIATAVARRAGVAEEYLDEVRLAVGEACSRAVAIHQQCAPDTPVSLAISDGRGRFSVTVSDTGTSAVAAPDFADLLPAATAGTVPNPSDAVSELLPPGFGLAVIAGLVDDVSVQTGDFGTTVAMSWPAQEQTSPHARNG